jgi:hypothetical protein
MKILKCYSVTSENRTPMGLSKSSDARGFRNSEVYDNVDKTWISYQFVEMLLIA